MERKWPRLDASRSHGSAPLRESHTKLLCLVVVFIPVLKDVRPDQLSDCEPTIGDSR